MATPLHNSTWWKRLTAGARHGRIAPLIGALIAIVPALLLVFLKFGPEKTPLGQTLITLSYDLPFFFRSHIPTDQAVIVYMDEQSYKALEQNYSVLWDRKLYASLIIRLKAEGARTIILDTIFSEPAPEEDTRALAAAIKAHGQVIMGADLLEAEAQGASSFAVSYSSFFREEAASAIVQFPADYDWGVRRHFVDSVKELPLFGVYDGTNFVPTLSWKAAQLAGSPVTPPTLKKNSELWVNYYGPPGFVPHISFFSALQPNGAPPGFFKDKTVFVGLLPPKTDLPDAKKEEYRTPYTFWTNKFAPGVEIHATMFLNLLRGDWLQRTSNPATFFLLLVVGAFAGYGLTVLRPVYAALAAFTGILLVFALALFSTWKLRVWFPWLIPVAVQIPAAFLWALGYNSLKLHIEKKILSRTLELHLSPQRVKQIIARPDLLAPGAERQEVSILFSDIANFSKVTARMDPDDLFALLNRYFQESLSCIHETDGTVIKLIGDAIFAIWNAPFQQPKQQEKACRAALLLRDRLVHFDESSRGLPLRTRVGLHTGFACVGNVGSADRFDYTAIGDPINLASRLEGLNKYLGTQVLASRQIQKVVEDSFVCRKVGYFRFKGMDTVTEVYELIATREDLRQIPEYIGAFEKALHSFERRNFSAAESGFREVLAVVPNDGPASFYLHRLAAFQQNPPPEDWTGEIQLEEK